MSVLDAFRLDGKVAVVTGAGRGLGRAIARALAEAGADVALGARTASDLADTARLVEAAGRRALAVPTDVTDETQVEEFAAAVVEAFGGVDVLVNNAGTVVVKPLADLEVAEWRRVIDTNLTGTFLCARAFGPHMIARQKGRVINIASVSGLVGEPLLTAYAASKGGVVNLTRALAAEWAKHGVTVNAIAPGYFDTAMTSQGLDDPEVAVRLIKRIPLRRVGEPDEIGPLAVYLASDASAYITGEIVVIDGGWHAR